MYIILIHFVSVWFCIYMILNWMIFEWLFTWYIVVAPCWDWCLVVWSFPGVAMLWWSCFPSIPFLIGEVSGHVYLHQPPLCFVHKRWDSSASAPCPASGWCWCILSITLIWSMLMLACIHVFTPWRGLRPWHNFATCSWAWMVRPWFLSCGPIWCLGGVYFLPFGLNWRGHSRKDPVHPSGGEP